MRLPPVGKGNHARGANTAEFVYREMLLQVCADYSGLPDVRTLTVSDILFFYDGLRGRLKEYQRRRAEA